MPKRIPLTPGQDFFVDGRSFRVVKPKQHLAMQRLQARLVDEQRRAIHFLINLVDMREPDFRHVVNKLRKPLKHQRLAVSALRKADNTRKKLSGYGMSWEERK